LEFTLTVGDHGTVAAKDVIVKDTLPDYLSILSVTASRGNVSTEGQTVLVVIGTVEPTDVITITIRARINQSAPSVGYNTAHISTSSPTDNPNNNSDTVTFVIPEPGVAATPIPIPPQLPNTGAPDDMLGSQRLLALLGLIMLALGLLLRRRTDRQQRPPNDV
jgi:uncharacterized repeat protein (TIGR01451 family)/MYXO-CTERM domain-containing protein